MVETEEKTKLTPQTSPETQVPADQIQPEKTTAPQQQKMSPGEKRYDWLVYKGLNYWVNLVSSIAITDWFDNGWFKSRKGSEILKIDALSEKMAKPVARLANIEEKLAHTKVRNTFTYLALLTGGNLLTFALKPLEDNKRKIVHGLNKKMGVDQTSPDGRELTPDEIYIENEQPKQSWGKVIGRRLLGIGAVLTAGNVVDSLYGKDNVTNYVMDGPNGKGGINKALKSIEVIPGVKKLQSRSAQAWMKYAVLDSVFTAITAAVFWVTRGAKKDDKKPVSTPAASITQQGSAVIAAEPVDSTAALAEETKTNFASREKQGMVQDTANKVPLTSYTEKAAQETNQPMQRA